MSNLSVSTLRSFEPIRNILSEFKDQKCCLSYEAQVEKINISLSSLKIEFGKKLWDEKIFSGTKMEIGYDSIIFSLKQEIECFLKVLENETSDLISRRHVTRAIYGLLSILEEIKSEYNNYVVMKEIMRERVLSLTAMSFENIIFDVVKKMNYVDVEKTKQTRDGGVDVIAYKEDGLSRYKTVFEAKKYRKKLGVQIVRNMHGVMEGCRADRGVIITASDFSRDCKALAERVEYRKIRLIDGEKFSDMLFTFEVGVKNESGFFVLDEQYLLKI